jgi:hypothetical protein
VNVVRRYLSLTEAAEYCGYRPRYFAKRLREYALPKYGEKGTRYRIEDLDLWMENPAIFQQVKPQRARGKAFTLVTA